MPEFCTVETDGLVLIVTINRPDQMSSLHGPAYFEMSEVLDAFESLAEHTFR